ncbi:MAG: acyl carrier protein [Pseudotabrizicola sp.]|uniref:acyl carrier protein n=1 Tax=Pseudotabrizicola sp. TaxID=2939647 RepID=UPI002730F1D9|nr:acyl carrier protein [Pseudotabrizicola sp.]MDP2079466.1 acyl carrier protein [Pseudotabrizicola sp.]MDZ7576345.1 acyl carrier protein [Pseudotabrizicola sp.]
MTQSDLRNVILEELVNVAPDLEVDQIGEDDHLLDDLGIDSMDFVNLLSALQARLDIPLPESDYPRLISLATIQRYLAEHGT